MRPVKLGFDSYSPQCFGLETRLRDRVDLVTGRSDRPSVEIVKLGGLINPPGKLIRGDYDHASPM